MQEFLNYELFGLMTVQTYLIIAVGCFVIDMAVDKKGTPAAKLFCSALIWPHTIFIFVLCLVMCLLNVLVLILKICLEM